MKDKIKEAYERGQMETLQNNPFCEACQEKNCLTGCDGKCAMIRVYLKATKGSA